MFDLGIIDSLGNKRTNFIRFKVEIFSFSKTTIAEIISCFASSFEKSRKIMGLLIFEHQKLLPSKTSLSGFFPRIFRNIKIYLIVYFFLPVYHDGLS